jgi:hypothetical protein
MPKGPALKIVGLLAPHQGNFRARRRTEKTSRLEEAESKVVLKIVAHGEISFVGLVSTDSPLISHIYETYVLKA